MVFNHVGPLSNVTPFTYRDGETYLDMLRRLRLWVDELTVLVNEGIITVGNAAIDATNAAIDAANSLAIMVAVDDAAIKAVLEGPVTNLSNTILEERYRLTDEKMAEILNGEVNNAVNSILASRIPWKRPRQYGVVGDGITDDTEYLQDCLNDGSTLFDVATYYINDTLTFPTQFSQLGLGPSSTKFKLGPLGKIVIGSQNEPSEFLGGSPNGETSGFLIDGDGVAPRGLICGNYGGRIHRDIVIQSCTANPLLVDSTQNSTFESIKVTGGAQTVILDHGAGGNHFSKCEFYGFSQYGIDFRNTGTIVGVQDVGYAYPQTLGCTDNTFISCLVELPTNTALAGINHRAGSFNAFIRCAIECVGTGMPMTSSAVLIGQLNTAISLGLRFDMCHFLGIGGLGARASVFNANSGPVLYSKTFVTKCIASGFNNIFIGHDNDYFYRSDNDFFTENGGGEYMPQSGSSPEWYDVLRGSSPTQFYPVGTLGSGWGATEDVSIRARKVGDTIELQGQAKCVAGIDGVLTDVVVSGLPIPNNGGRMASFPIGQAADNTTATGQTLYVYIDYSGNASIATLQNNVPPNTIVHFDGVTYPLIGA